jgi:hypothetical protein
MMRDSRAWKVAEPLLLLCAASAGVTFACVRMSDSNREQHMGKITIEHVHVETEKPFGEVSASVTSPVEGAIPTPSCSSPRVIVHAEKVSRAHVDLIR